MQGGLQERLRGPALNLLCVGIERRESDYVFSDITGNPERFQQGVLQQGFGKSLDTADVVQVLAKIDQVSTRQCLMFAKTLLLFSTQEVVTGHGWIGLIVQGWKQ